ncbi:hypothetical protein PSTT_10655, partial [Puccinia striiformis]
LPCWSESWVHCPQSSSQIHVANFTPHKKNNMIAALKLFFIAISLLAHISPSRAQGGCLSRAVNAADCNGWLSWTDFEHLSRLCFYLPSTDLHSHLFKTAQSSVSPTDVTIHLNKVANLKRLGYPDTASNSIQRRDIDHAAQAILNGCNGRGGSTAIRSTDGATIQVKLQ